MQSETSKVHIVHSVVCWLAVSEVSGDLKADCKRILHGRTGDSAMVIEGQTQNPNLYPVDCFTRRSRRRARRPKTTTTATTNKSTRTRMKTAAVGRCSPLDVSTSICGSRWPRTGLLSPVSPNQKTGSVPPADWSSTATVRTAIGQPARVTHGYRLHQQHLRSICATPLLGPAYSSTLNVSHTRRD